MRRGPQAHTLAGAYALDALPARDRSAFGRHLRRCEACREEMEGLREAAGRLAAGPAMAPPPGLRDRVLAQVAGLPQLAAGGDGARLRWPRRDRRAGGTAPDGRRAAPGGQRPQAHPVGAPRLAVAVASVALLAALVLGGLVLSTRHRLGQVQARGGAIAAVLTAPDATMMSASARGGGRATVVMSHAERKLVLTTAHLPALPAGERYEVWLMGPGGGARPGGMLPSAHHGMTAPVLVTGLAAGERVGLTAEPAGGAARPTSPPVVMLPLPS